MFEHQEILEHNDEDSIRGHLVRLGYMEDQEEIHIPGHQGFSKMQEWDGCWIDLMVDFVESELQLLLIKKRSWLKRWAFASSVL
jgi:hypothetical protein